MDKVRSCHRTMRKCKECGSENLVIPLWPTSIEYTCMTCGYIYRTPGENMNE